MKLLHFIFISLATSICVSCGNKHENLLDQIITEDTNRNLTNSQSKDTTYETILGDFQTDIVQIKIGGKYGLFDTINNLCLTPIKYDEIGFFAGDGIISFSVNDKFGFLNGEGKVIVAAQYDYVLEFANGLAGVKMDEKWGYVNTLGDVTIPIEYDMAWTFSLKNRAAVKKNGKWGFVDSSGAYVIEPIYDDVSRTFERETKVANVSIKSHHFFIDVNGTYLKDSAPYDKYGE